MRVSNQMLRAEVLANLQAHAERLQALQVEVADGKRVRTPADDPIAAGRALSLRDSLAINEAYLDNNGTVSAWLDASEAALQNLVEIIGRALNTAREAASDTMGDDERATFAIQVTNLIDEALDALNTRFQDQYLFAGFKTTGSTRPFTLATGTPDTVSYNGDAGLRYVEIEPPGRTVQMNVAGQLASGAEPWTDANALFPHLIALRDALASPAAGDTIRAQIDNLETDLQTTLNVIADTGARQQRLNRTRTRVEKVQVALEGYLSETADASLAEAILRLKEEETAYTASLNAAARLNQHNLFDFLG